MLRKLPFWEIEKRLQCFENFADKAECLAWTSLLKVNSPYHNSKAKYNLENTLFSYYLMKFGKNKIEFLWSIIVNFIWVILLFRLKRKCCLLWIGKLVRNYVILCFESVKMRRISSKLPNSRLSCSNFEQLYFMSKVNFSPVKWQLIKAQEKKPGKTMKSEINST